MHKLDRDIAQAPELYEHLGWAFVLVAVLLIGASCIAAAIASALGLHEETVGVIAGFVRMVLPESPAGFATSSLMLAGGAAIVWRARWWRAVTQRH